MADTFNITASTEQGPVKLAKASVSSWDLTGDTHGPAYYNRLTNEPDKLYVPDKWPDLVKMIRFYYEKDPIASSVINKSVDIAINSISNEQGDAEDRVQEVYEALKDELHAFLKEMAREYLLSGLDIPEIIWGSKLIKVGNENEIFTVPVSYWLRDPATIILKKTPIPNRINYYVQIDSETIEFIMSNGVYPDGTKDPETFAILTQEYPEFVAAVKRGATTFPLQDIFCVIKRSPVTGKVYPTPYLLPVLESLTYKRKLRKMDYSIASRVISAIQLIKMGDKDFPLLAGDEQQIADLKAEVRHEGRENNIERVFQLFGNHTLTIEWIFPDTKAMLDKTKYDTANSDIMFGLGFPRILLSGETERSATSSPEFAMFSPSESLKAMRNDLLPFVRKLYEEIAKLNGFDKYPTMKFADLNLYDVSKMAGVVTMLIEKAGLSQTSALKVAGGFDFETEAENRVREREIMKENDLPEFNPTPFSPQPQVPGKPNPNNKTEEETE
jgi:hypothetical protein